MNDYNKSNVANYIIIIIIIIIYESGSITCKISEMFIWKCSENYKKLIKKIINILHLGISYETSIYDDNRVLARIIEKPRTHHMNYLNNNTKFKYEWL